MEEFMKTLQQMKTKDGLKKVSAENFFAIKALFFCVNVAFYACYSYRGPFFKHYLKVDDAAFMVTVVLLSLVVFLASPVWAWLADKTGRVKWLLAASLIGSAASFALFSIFEPGEENSKRNQVSIMVVTVVYSFFSAGMVPLLDGACLAVLLSSPGGSKELYGRQRLFGTLAYAVTTAVAGYVFEKTDYKSAVYVTLVCTVIGLIAVFTLLPDKLKFQKKHASVKVEGDVKWYNKPVFQVLQKGDFQFFVLVVLINGLARHVLQNYLAVYATGKITDKKNYGLMTFPMAAAEIILFFFGKPLMKKLGPYWFLVLAQLLMVVRVMYYWLIPDRDRTYEWSMFFIEILKGIGSSFMQMAGVYLSHESAPEGLEATAQGMFSSLYGGLSAIAGSYLGGDLRRTMGDKGMFKVTFIISAVGWVLVFFKYGIFDAYIRKPIKKEAGEKKAIELTKVEQVMAEKSVDETSSVASDASTMKV